MYGVEETVVVDEGRLFRLKVDFRVFRFFVTLDDGKVVLDVR